MKYSILLLTIGTVILSTACNSYKPMGIVQCPAANTNDSIYAEIYYKYKFLSEVPREKIDPVELKRMDSLFSFTVTASGHEGWARNTGARFNEYYHPDYFVLENPHEFKGKPRTDHHFSTYCPNQLSEMIRLHINNDLGTSITDLMVSVKPYKYLYDKKKKQYRALLEVVAVDSIFFR